MDKYRCLPLDAGRREIRLLDLHPGRFTDNVQVDINIVSLTDIRLPKYEALSYCWGDVNKSKFVYVGTSEQKTIPVTENLEEALRFLRYEVVSRKLWIDAVSIDQDNLLERGQQIQLISQVFETASKVVVWLGPEAVGSRLALQELERLTQNVEFIPGTTEVFGRGGEGLAMGSEALDSIMLLLDRPWFERLWIRQEIHLANIAELQCGHDRLPWTIFRDAIRALSSLRILTLYRGVLEKRGLWDDERDAPRFQNMFSRLTLIRNNLCFDPSYDFITTMQNGRSASCYDCRDRVYALLGIAPQSQGLHPLNIVADYGKPFQFVYKDFVLEMLQQCGSLEVLTACAGNTGGSKSDCALPTWVPDWSLDQYELPRMLAESYAGGMLRSVAKYEYVEPDQLHCKGVYVSTIKTVTASFPGHHWPHALEVCQLIRQLAQQHVGPGVDIPYRGRLTRIEAFCDVLCHGQFSETFTDKPRSLPTLAQGVDLCRDILARSTADGLMKLIWEMRTPTPASEFLVRTERSLWRRSFASTLDDRMCLVPSDTQAGDVLCVLLGCSKPLVLRPIKHGQYALLGHAYVHGMMQAQAFFGDEPASLQFAVNRKESGDAYGPGFIDLDTGEWKAGHWHSPAGDSPQEVTKKAIKNLEERGGTLTTFVLI